MRKVMFIMICFTLLFLTSCEDVIKDKGAIPTKPFTVSNYLDNNAVYEGNSSLTINGTSEANVIIRVELISKKNKTVETYESVVNEKNLTWSVTFDTPKISNDYYKIKISDAHSTYVYEYTNIRFGYLWLVAGDGFINYPIKLTEDDDYDELNEISFYDVSSNSHWLTNSEKLTQVSSFDFEFAKRLVKKVNAPVGIVVGDEHSTLIDEWLPLDSAKSFESIDSYLKKNHRYSDNLSKGDACYLFERELKQLEGINLSGIIWSQGDNQTNLFSDKAYEKVYFDMLTTVLEKWREFFKTQKIVVLQAKSSESEYTQKLRYVQNTAVNYYTYAKIVPTFDLVDEDAKRQSDVDIKKVAERTIDIINGSKSVSSYANLILDINELDVVDKIKIEFNNTKELEVKDEAINYLVVRYLDKDLGSIILDLKPEVLENYLVFDLSYTEEEANELGELVPVTKYYDKSLITIEFGQNANLENINIFNDDMIPLLPFSIKIE